MLWLIRFHFRLALELAAIFSRGPGMSFFPYPLDREEGHCLVVNYRLDRSVGGAMLNFVCSFLRGGEALTGTDRI